MEKVTVLYGSRECTIIVPKSFTYGQLADEAARSLNLLTRQHASSNSNSAGGSPARALPRADGNALTYVLIGPDGIEMQPSIFVSASPGVAGAPRVLTLQPKPGQRASKRDITSSATGAASSSFSQKNASVPRTQSLLSTVPLSNIEAGGSFERRNTAATSLLRSTLTRMSGAGTMPTQGGGSGVGLAQPTPGTSGPAPHLSRHNSLAGHPAPTGPSPLASVAAALSSMSISNASSGVTPESRLPSVASAYQLPVNMVQPSKAAEVKPAPPAYKPLARAATSAAAAMHPAARAGLTEQRSMFDVNSAARMPGNSANVQRQPHQNQSVPPASTATSLLAPVLQRFNSVITNTTGDGITSVKTTSSAGFAVETPSSSTSGTISVTGSAHPASFYQLPKTDSQKSSGSGMVAQDTPRSSSAQSLPATASAGPAPVLQITMPPLLGLKLSAEAATGVDAAQQQAGNQLHSRLPLPKRCLLPLWHALAERCVYHMKANAAAVPRPTTHLPALPLLEVAQCLSASTIDLHHSLVERQESQSRGRQHNATPQQNLARHGLNVPVDDVAALLLRLQSHHQHQQQQLQPWIAFHTILQASHTLAFSVVVYATQVHASTASGQRIAAQAAAAAPPSSATVHRAQLRLLAIFTQRLLARGDNVHQSSPVSNLSKHRHSGTQSVLQASSVPLRRLLLPPHLASSCIGSGGLSWAAGTCSALGIDARGMGPGLVLLATSYASALPPSSPLSSPAAPAAAQLAAAASVASMTSNMLPSAPAAATAHLSFHRVMTLAADCGLVKLLQLPLHVWAAAFLMCTDAHAQMERTRARRLQKERNRRSGIGAAATAAAGSTALGALSATRKSAGMDQTGRSRMSDVTVGTVMTYVSTPEKADPAEPLLQQQGREPDDSAGAIVGDDSTGGTGAAESSRPPATPSAPVPVSAIETPSQRNANASPAASARTNSKRARVHAHPSRSLLPSLLHATIPVDRFAHFICLAAISSSAHGLESGIGTVAVAPTAQDSAFGSAATAHQQQPPASTRLALRCVLRSSEWPSRSHDIAQQIASAGAVTSAGVVKSLLTAAGVVASSSASTSTSAGAAGESNGSAAAGHLQTDKRAAACGVAALLSASAVLTVVQMTQVIAASLQRARVDALIGSRQLEVPTNGSPATAGSGADVDGATADAWPSKVLLDAGRRFTSAFHAARSSDATGVPSSQYLDALRSRFDKLEKLTAGARKQQMDANSAMRDPPSSSSSLLLHERLTAVIPVAGPMSAFSGSQQQQQQQPDYHAVAVIMRTGLSEAASSTFPTAGAVVDGPLEGGTTPAADGAVHVQNAAAEAENVDDDDSLSAGYSSGGSGIDKSDGTLGGSDDNSSSSDSSLGTLSDADGNSDSDGNGEHAVSGDDRDDDEEPRLAFVDEPSRSKVVTARPTLSLCGGRGTRDARDSNGSTAGRPSAAAPTTTPTSRLPSSSASATIATPMPAQPMPAPAVAIRPVSEPLLVPLATRPLPAQATTHSSATASSQGVSQPQPQQPAPAPRVRILPTADVEGVMKVNDAAAATVAAVRRGLALSAKGRQSMMRREILGPLAALETGTGIPPTAATSGGAGYLAPSSRGLPPSSASSTSFDPRASFVRVTDGGAMEYPVSMSENEMRAHRDGSGAGAGAGAGGGGVSHRSSGVGDGIGIGAGASAHYRPEQLLDVLGLTGTPAGALILELAAGFLRDAGCEDDVEADPLPLQNPDRSALQGDGRAAAVPKSARKIGAGGTAGAGNNDAKDGRDGSHSPTGDTDTDDSDDDAGKGAAGDAGASRPPVHPGQGSNGVKGQHATTSTAAGGGSRLARRSNARLRRSSGYGSIDDDDDEADVAGGSGNDGTEMKESQRSPPIPGAGGLGRVRARAASADDIEHDIDAMLSDGAGGGGGDNGAGSGGGGSEVGSRRRDSQKQQQQHNKRRSRTADGIPTIEVATAPVPETGGTVSPATNTPAPADVQLTSRGVTGGKTTAGNRKESAAQSARSASTVRASASTSAAPADIEHPTTFKMAQPARAAAVAAINRVMNPRLARSAAVAVAWSEPASALDRLERILQSLERAREALGAVAGRTYVWDFVAGVAVHGGGASANGDVQRCNDPYLSFPITNAASTTSASTSSDTAIRPLGIDAGSANVYVHTKAKFVRAAPPGGGHADAAADTTAGLQPAMHRTLSATSSSSSTSHGPDGARRSSYTTIIPGQHISIGAASSAPSTSAMASVEAAGAAGLGAVPLRSGHADIGNGSVGGASTVYSSVVFTNPSTLDSRGQGLQSGSIGSSITHGTQQVPTTSHVSHQSNFTGIESINSSSSSSGLGTTVGGSRPEVASGFSIEQHAQLQQSPAIKASRPAIIAGRPPTARTNLVQNNASQLQQGPAIVRAAGLNSAGSSSSITMTTATGVTSGSSGSHGANGATSASQSPSSPANSILSPAFTLHTDGTIDGQLPIAVAAINAPRRLSSGASAHPQLPPQLQRGTSNRRSVAFATSTAEPNLSTIYGGGLHAHPSAGSIAIGVDGMVAASGTLHTSASLANLLPSQAQSTAVVAYWDGASGLVPLQQVKLPTRPKPAALHSPNGSSSGMVGRRNSQQNLNQSQQQQQQQVPTLPPGLPPALVRSAVAWAEYHSALLALVEAEVLCEALAWRSAAEEGSTHCKPVSPAASSSPGSSSGIDGTVVHAQIAAPATSIDIDTYRSSALEVDGLLVQACASLDRCFALRAPWPAALQLMARILSKRALLSYPMVLTAEAEVETIVPVVLPLRTPERMVTTLDVRPGTSDAVAEPSESSIAGSLAPAVHAVGAGGKAVGAAPLPSDAATAGGMAADAEAKLPASKVRISGKRWMHAFLHSKPASMRLLHAARVATHLGAQLEHKRVATPTDASPFGDVIAAANHACEQLDHLIILRGMMMESLPLVPPTPLTKPGLSVSIPQQPDAEAAIKQQIASIRVVTTGAEVQSAAVAAPGALDGARLPDGALISASSSWTSRVVLPTAMPTHMRDILLAGDTSATATATGVSAVGVDGTGSIEDGGSTAGYAGVRIAGLSRAGLVAAWRLFSSFDEDCDGVLIGTEIARMWALLAPVPDQQQHGFAGAGGATSSLPATISMLLSGGGGVFNSGSRSVWEPWVRELDGNDDDAADPYAGGGRESRRDDDDDDDEAPASGRGGGLNRSVGPGLRRTSSVSGGLGYASRFQRPAVTAVKRAAHLAALQGWFASRFSSSYLVGGDDDAARAAPEALPRSAPPPPPVSGAQRHRRKNRKPAAKAKGGQASSSAVPLTAPTPATARVYEQLNSDTENEGGSREDGADSSTMEGSSASSLSSAASKSTATSSSPSSSGSGQKRKDRPGADSPSAVDGQGNANADSKQQSKRHKLSSARAEATTSAAPAPASSTASPLSITVWSAPVVTSLHQVLMRYRSYAELRSGDPPVDHADIQASAAAIEASLSAPQQHVYKSYHYSASKGSFGRSYYLYQAGAIPPAVFLRTFKPRLRNIKSPSKTSEAASPSRPPVRTVAHPQVASVALAAAIAGSTSVGNGLEEYDGPSPSSPAIEAPPAITTPRDDDDGYNAVAGAGGARRGAASGPGRKQRRLTLGLPSILRSLLPRVSSTSKFRTTRQSGTTLSGDFGKRKHTHKHGKSLSRQRRGDAVKRTAPAPILCSRVPTVSRRPAASFTVPSSGGGITFPAFAEYVWWMSLQDPMRVASAFQSAGVLMSTLDLGIDASTGAVITTTTAAGPSTVGAGIDASMGLASPDSTPRMVDLRSASTPNALTPAGAPSPAQAVGTQVPAGILLPVTQLGPWARDITTAVVLRKDPLKAIKRVANAAARKGASKASNTAGGANGETGGISSDGGNDSSTSSGDDGSVSTYEHEQGSDRQWQSTRRSRKVEGKSGDETTSASSSSADVAVGGDGDVDAARTRGRQKQKQAPRRPHNVRSRPTSSSSSSSPSLVSINSDGTESVTSIDSDLEYGYEGYYPDQYQYFDGDDGGGIAPMAAGAGWRDGRYEDRSGRGSTHSGSDRDGTARLLQQYQQQLSSTPTRNRSSTLFSSNTNGGVTPSSRSDGGGRGAVGGAESRSHSFASSNPGYAQGGGSLLPAGGMVGSRGGLGGSYVYPAGLQASQLLASSSVVRNRHQRGYSTGQDSNGSGGGAGGLPFPSNAATAAARRPVPNITALMSRGLGGLYQNDSRPPSFTINGAGISESNNNTQNTAHALPGGIPRTSIASLAWSLAGSTSTTSSVSANSRSRSDTGVTGSTNQSTSILQAAALAPAAQVAMQQQQNRHSRVPSDSVGLPIDGDAPASASPSAAALAVTQQQHSGAAPSSLTLLPHQNPYLQSFYAASNVVHMLLPNIMDDRDEDGANGNAHAAAAAGGSKDRRFTAENPAKGAVSGAVAVDAGSLDKPKHRRNRHKHAAQPREPSERQKYERRLYLHLLRNYGGADTEAYRGRSGTFGGSSAGGGRGMVQSDSVGSFALSQQQQQYANAQAAAFASSRGGRARAGTNTSGSASVSTPSGNLSASRSLLLQQQPQLLMSTPNRRQSLAVTLSGASANATSAAVGSGGLGTPFNPAAASALSSSSRMNRHIRANSGAVGYGLLGPSLSVPTYGGGGGGGPNPWPAPPSGSSTPSVSGSEFAGTESARVPMDASGRRVSMSGRAMPAQALRASMLGSSATSSPLAQAQQQQQGRLLIGERAYISSVSSSTQSRGHPHQSMRQQARAEAAAYRHSRDGGRARGYAISAQTPRTPGYSMMRSTMWGSTVKSALASTNNALQPPSRGASSSSLQHLQQQQLQQQRQAEAASQADRHKLRMQQAAASGWASIIFGAGAAYQQYPPSLPLSHLDYDWGRDEEDDDEEGVCGLGGGLQDEELEFYRTALAASTGLAVATSSSPSASEVAARALLQQVADAAPVLVTRRGELQLKLGRSESDWVAAPAQQLVHQAAPAAAVGPVVSTIKAAGLASSDEDTKRPTTAVTASGGTSRPGTAPTTAAVPPATSSSPPSTALVPSTGSYGAGSSAAGKQASAVGSGVAGMLSLAALLPPTLQPAAIAHIGAIVNTLSRSDKLRLTLSASQLSLLHTALLHYHAMAVRSQRLALLLTVNGKKRKRQAQPPAQATGLPGIVSSTAIDPSAAAFASDGTSAASGNPYHSFVPGTEPPRRLFDYYLVVGRGDLLADIDISGTTGFADLEFEPKTYERVPKEDWAGMPLPANVGMFAFPDGLRLHIGAPKPPSIFYFVLTFEDGSKLYCASAVVWKRVTPSDAVSMFTSSSSNLSHSSSASSFDAGAAAAGGSATISPPWLDLTALQQLQQRPSSREWPYTNVYAPKAHLLISHCPMFGVMRSTLGELLRQQAAPGAGSAPVAFPGNPAVTATSPVPPAASTNGSDGTAIIVDHLINDVPLPPRGYCSTGFTLGDKHIVVARPPINQLPLIDVPLEPLFQCLDMANVIAAFTTLLCERRLALCSRHVHLLTPVAEALCALIFPFRWVVNYIPVLPAAMVEIIGAPTPYLIGWCGSVDEAQAYSAETVFIDLDANVVHIPAYAPLPKLPEKTKKKLVKALKLHAYGSTGGGVGSDQPRGVFSGFGFGRGNANAAGQGSNSSGISYGADHNAYLKSTVERMGLLWPTQPSGPGAAAPQYSATAGAAASSSSAGVPPSTRQLPSNLAAAPPAGTVKPPIVPTGAPSAASTAAAGSTSAGVVPSASSPGNTSSSNGSSAVVDIMSPLACIINGTNASVTSGGQRGAATGSSINTSSQRVSMHPPWSAAHHQSTSNTAGPGASSARWSHLHSGSIDVSILASRLASAGGSPSAASAAASVCFGWDWESSSGGGPNGTGTGVSGSGSGKKAPAGGAVSSDGSGDEATPAPAAAVQSTVGRRQGAAMSAQLQHQNSSSGTATPAVLSNAAAAGQAGLGSLDGSTIEIDVPILHGLDAANNSGVASTGAAAQTAQGLSDTPSSPPTHPLTASEQHSSSDTNVHTSLAHGFNPQAIRHAFLSFFVSIFKDYYRYVQYTRVGTQPREVAAAYVHRAIVGGRRKAVLACGVDPAALVVAGQGGSASAIAGSAASGSSSSSTLLLLVMASSDPSPSSALALRTGNASAPSASASSLRSLGVTLPVLPSPILSVSFDRDQFLSDHSASRDLCAAMFGTQLFQVFEQALVPPVYRATTNPGMGSGGGGGSHGNHNGNGRRGGSAPGSDGDDDDGEGIGLPWDPVEADPAFPSRLPPSIRLFNAHINAKLNRLATQSRMGGMLGRGRAKVQLDSSFLDDHSTRIRRHVAIPPPARLYLMPAAGEVQGAASAPGAPKLQASIPSEITSAIHAVEHLATMPLHYFAIPTASRDANQQQIPSSASNGALAAAGNNNSAVSSGGFGHSVQAHASQLLLSPPATSNKRDSQRQQQQYARGRAATGYSYGNSASNNNYNGSAGTPLGSAHAHAYHAAPPSSTVRRHHASTNYGSAAGGGGGGSNRHRGGGGGGLEAFLVGFGATGSGTGSGGTSGSASRRGSAALAAGISSGDLQAAMQSMSAAQLQQLQMMQQGTAHRANSNVRISRRRGVGAAVGEDQQQQQQQAAPVGASRRHVHSTDGIPTAAGTHEAGHLHVTGQRRHGGAGGSGTGSRQRYLRQRARQQQQQVQQ